MSLLSLWKYGLPGSSWFPKESQNSHLTLYTFSEHIHKINSNMKSSNSNCTDKRWDYVGLFFTSALNTSRFNNNLLYIIDTPGNILVTTALSILDSSISCYTVVIHWLPVFRSLISEILKKNKTKLDLYFVWRAFPYFIFHSLISHLSASFMGPVGRRTNIPLSINSTSCVHLFSYCNY